MKLEKSKPLETDAISVSENDTSVIFVGAFGFGVGLAHADLAKLKAETRDGGASQPEFGAGDAALAGAFARVIESELADESVTIEFVDMKKTNK